MKRNIVKMSLVTAMILTSGAYSAQIVGADAGEGNVPLTQFGFGGFNLENVTVNMVTGEDNDPIVGTFDPDTGMYPQMALGDSYESSVFSSVDDKTDPATRLGYVVQKIWPISEPTGIKVVNDDLATNNGKPYNCIMASSYLVDSNLDTGTPPTPVICSSDAGTSKRFQLILNDNVVVDTIPGAYGEYVDLVFNIDSSATDDARRYQVFQKVSNFTSKRLDGFILEVLDENNATNAALTLSLGEGEEREPVDGNLTGGDLFPASEIAFYPPGLWGDGEKKHLPEGWFDILPAGYFVSLNDDNNTMTSGARQSGNYVELFGNWQPDKWVPWGMHEVIDPLAEPELIAYWGTTPTEDFNDAPAWHYGMDHNLTDGDQSWAEPTQEEIDKWAADPEKYVIDDIEDVPNVSLNYIVNVGVGITNKFIIRIRPKVSVDQSPPSYISKDDNESYIVPPQLWVPPTADAGPDKSVQVNETVTITGTGTDSDGTIDSYEWKFGTTVVATTDSFSFAPDTVGAATLTLTVTDNNGLTDTDSMNLTVTEVPVDPVDPVDPTDPPAAELPPVYYPSSGGGGCTYNPNSNSFDMTFLMMMALGLLYPFRRRFLK